MEDNRLNKSKRRNTAEEKVLEIESLNLLTKGTHVVSGYTHLFILPVFTQILKFKDKGKARASNARQVNRLKEEKEWSQILHNI